jgi:hypothetical protein
MLEWLNLLTDQPKATVIGAIIGALTTLFAVLVKGYLIPLTAEKRLQRNKRKESFKGYSDPLILSAISFLYRTKEIFDSGDFLLATTPKNVYNEYKCLSTLYRLCVLLGWIRAIKIELSHIEVKNTKEFDKIEKSLSEFEKSLADGGHIELSRLECLCKLWNLDYSNIPDINKKYLGTQVELLIDKATYSEKIDTPDKLKNSSKMKLVSSVSKLVSEKTGYPQVPPERLKTTSDEAIKEMSRIESWIYRDWQSAIGDLMIKQNHMGLTRKYDVLSFFEFENLCFKGDSSTTKWLRRIDGLFSDLNTQTDDRFDARKQQLKNTYNSVIGLIETFSTITKSNVDLTKTAITNLKGKI